MSEIHARNIKYDNKMSQIIWRPDITRRRNKLIEEVKQMDKLKKGDWVSVAGDGNTAYQVKWVKGNTVGLSSGWKELIHKVEKLDPEKFKIISYTVNTWRRMCKSPDCCYYEKGSKYYCSDSCAEYHNYKKG